MFEKEAEERARKIEENQTLGVYDNDEEYARDRGWNEGEVVGYEEGFKDGAEFGYNKAFVEADKNLKAIVTDFNKANEWHKADIPTSQINKVVLGYIKDYNSKMFCLVKWNGEWWYDARTYNDRVKLLAWKEIVLPKESEMTDDLYYRKLESTSTSDLVDMLREKDRRIAELEEENEGLKAFESHCDEIEEDAKAIAKENAELKEKLDKIRNYLAYDIFDRFKYLENLLKISQETQEELSKRILEQQKTIGSAIKNQIEKILNKFK